MTAPELFVTNFNRNFTGVSATAAGVIRRHNDLFDMRVVGQALPGCPAPISVKQAMAACKMPPPGRAFSIWHVRRNTEMRAAIWARDVLRRPIKIVFTSAAQRRHSAFPRWLISRMDAVIATTERAAEFVPNVKAVVPHGVDTNCFYPADVALPYPGEVFLATIGRVREEKGTDLFVRAMERVLPEFPGATALIVGKTASSDAGFKAALETRIKAAGLSERILFTGEIGAGEMPKLMQGLDLLVALPRYEGYGMTPLEAMACGVPFVGSDTGYFEVFSAQRKAGEIVEIGDVDGAAEKIRAILSNKALHKKMSRAAAQIARDGHSVAREAHDIRAVYDQLWAAG